METKSKAILATMNLFNELDDLKKELTSIDKNMSISNEVDLMDINDTLEILNSKIYDFIKTIKLSKNNLNLNLLDNVKKNNKVVEDLMPLFIMYRHFLDQ